MKAQGLLELLPIGILDPLAVVTRVLEAQEQPAIQQLFNQQVQQTGQFQPPPDPKVQELQMKSQAEQQKAVLKQQELQFKSELAARDQAFKHAMEKQAQDAELRFKALSAQLDAVATLHKERSNMQAAAAKTGQNMLLKDQEHQQSMRHQEEKASLAKQQTQTSSKTGKSTR
jgi:hypothetical protein